MNLTPRLQTIYGSLLPNEEVWDVCCDHGQLGLAALKSNQFPLVHFVDQVPEIIDSLPKGFLNARYYPQPAEDLNIPLSGNIVIAGVGAHTILSSLNSWEAKGLLKAKRLILCPQKNLELIVHQKRAGYNLDKIESVDERGRLKSVLIYNQSS